MGTPLFPGPTMSGDSWSCQVPRAPLHEPGVTLLVVVSWTPSAGVFPAFIASTGSCVSPQPSLCLWSHLGHRVCAGCWQPRLGGGPSRRYSAHLSLRAWPPPPAARGVHLPVTSHPTAACPSCGPGRRAAKPVLLWYNSSGHQDKRGKMSGGGVYRCQPHGRCIRPRASEKREGC
jgi:hypothetical protein